MVSMAGSKWLKRAVLFVWLNSLLSELVMNRGVECSLYLASGIVQSGSPERQQTVLTDRSERIALFRLRSSLGLRSRDWPKKVDPCATWRGIKCQSGHVIELNISGFRRTVVGARSPQFAVDGLQILTFLQTFNASGFALPGSIPDWFGQLTALRVLDLSSALITGSVPPSLGQLINVNALVLSRNSLTGFIPPTLGQLSNLRVLDLSLNDFIGSIPSSFSNLVNLTLLDLSANKLQGRIPNGVGELPKLRHLLLSNNNLNGSIPTELGNLSLLNDLDLSSNGLFGSIPREFGRLKSLNNLVLANNVLSDLIPVEIYNCTELRALVLDHNNLSGSLPKSVGSLTKLLSLDVSYNNLTGHLPDTISGLVNIKSINVSRNQFYESLPSSLSKLSELIAFDLSDNYFEKKLPNISSRAIVSDERNCLQGVSNQRKITDCTLFYSERRLSFAGFGVTGAPNPFSIPNVTGEGSSQKNRHLGAIFGGVFGGLGLVLLVIVLVFFVLKYERRADHKQRDSQLSAPRGGHSTAAISVSLASLGESFTYEQLLQATGEFSPSNLIKNGHSGDLYQGLLEGGVAVVVKRIPLNSHRRDAYLAELDIFGKASHTRLVPLLGHCLEREDEKLLVYKYMPNRDLSYALYRKASSPEDTLQSLDWITRLKIAIGAAEGLTFLHHECTPPLVHRDVQASSILLDDKFEVRLGSLSETCSQEGEVHQSVISRLLRISQTSEQGVAGSAVATCAYDVYCFGKVLMELVSGKLGISGSNDPSAYAWLDWALPLINIYEKESVTKIVDPSLIVDEDLLEEVWAMAIVAKSCLNPKPSKRPLMRYILKALENPLKVVREDNGNTSARLRTSSRGSWNAALFGSWRHSSSEMVAIPGTLRDEYIQKGILKRSATAGSQGSGQGGDVSSHKRLSNEIFPEPVEGAVVPASSTDLEKQED